MSNVILISIINTEGYNKKKINSKGTFSTSDVNVIYFSVEVLMYIFDSLNNTHVRLCTIESLLNLL